MKPFVLFLFVVLTQILFAQGESTFDTKQIEARIIAKLTEGNNNKTKGDYVAAYKSLSEASSLTSSLDSGNYYFLKTEEALALWLHDVGFIKEAIQRQQSLLSQLEKFHPTDKEFGIALRGALAGWYIEYEDFDRALYHFKKNIDLSNELNTVKDASQYNNLGWFYLQAKEYDAAYINFTIALAFKKHETNYDFHFSVYDNLGDLFTARKQYDSSLYYFNKCAKLLENYKLEPHRPLQLHYKFARNYFLGGQYDQATRELIMLDKLLKIHSGDKRDYDQKAAELWYQLLEGQGKKAEALYYYKKLIEIKEKVRSSKELANQDVINMMVEQNLSQVNLQLKYEQELLERKEQELEFNRYFIIWIIVLSLIIIFAGQRIYRSRNRKIKAISEKLEVSNKLKESEIQIKKLEQEKLEAILESKKKDISEMSLLVQSLRKLQSDLNTKVKSIRRVSPTEQANELKRVIAEIHTSIDNSQKATHLQEHIEQVNDRFYQVLNQKHPDLTKSETELCALIRVNMRSNEIASLKNMALTSVKQSKRRLRRKLGLEMNADLYQYLKELTV